MSSFRTFRSTRSLLPGRTGRLPSPSLTSVRSASLPYLKRALSTGSVPNRKGRRLPPEPPAWFFELFPGSAPHAQGAASALRPEPARSPLSLLTPLKRIWDAINAASLKSVLRAPKQDTPDESSPQRKPLPTKDDHLRREQIPLEEDPRKQRRNAVKETRTARRPSAVEAHPNRRRSAEEENRPGQERRAKGDRRENRKRGARRTGRTVEGREPGTGLGGER